MYEFMAPSRLVTRETHCKRLILMPQTVSGKKNILEACRRVIIALSATLHVAHVHTTSTAFCFETNCVSFLSSAGDKVREQHYRLRQWQQVLITCSKKDNLERQSGSLHNKVVTLINLNREGYMRSMQWQLELGNHLSICLKTEENHGKP
jgi:hypothetical protein